MSDLEDNETVQADAVQEPDQEPVVEVKPQTWRQVRAANMRKAQKAKAERQRKMKEEMYEPSDESEEEEPLEITVEKKKKRPRKNADDSEVKYRLKQTEKELAKLKQSNRMALYKARREEVKHAAMAQPKPVQEQAQQEPVRQESKSNDFFSVFDEKRRVRWI